jgi:cobalt-precorrin 5A hydrolase
MIAAGVGCRGGCPREDVLSALDAALAQAGRERGEVSALYAPEEKAAEAGLHAAAHALDRPLVLLPRRELAAQAGRALTSSPHAMAHHGVPSVAETAALAGALRLDSRAEARCAPRLLGPRQVAGSATCALAMSEEKSS